MRTKTGEEFVDGEKPVYGSNPDMASIAASKASLQPSRSLSFFGDDNKEMKPGPSNNNIKLTVEPPKRKVGSPANTLYPLLTPYFVVSCNIPLPI